MSALPPSAFTHLQCSICGEVHSAALPQTVCTSCGRPLFARYDLGAARRTLTRASLADRPWTMWRYAEVMPVIDRTFVISLGEGMTPLLHAARLGGSLGIPQLYVKDEGQNPTGTFKARGLSAAISKANEYGIGEVGVPTAGNAGSAAAAYAAAAGMTAHVAMPADAPPVVMDEVRTFGAHLSLVDGLISDAGRLIALGVAEQGWLDLSTLKEPFRVEGKKTMGYELWEQFGGELPQVVVYPTGGGTGLIGMWKAFDELEEMGLIGAERPQMIAVQAEGCAPIVRAFDAGAVRAEPWLDAETLAPGIRVPSPFADDLILSAIRASNGVAVSVSDDDILDAMGELAEEEGIDAAPEGAATLAGVRKLVASGVLNPAVSVVLFNTGSGLKHPELRERVRERMD
ncbi:MAG: threonine synthase [Chloroflexi bacterium]|nr:threonine synthase [Chloroflexota bacterium]MDA1002673.1 threonine synthase [Chloroflexota bacterium]MQC27573.1 threonine synthase [Chloroflexota bacterium]